MSCPLIKAVIKENKKELKAAYGGCQDVVEKRRIQAIWLLGSGKSREEVKEVTAYSTSTLLDVIQRYNQDGLAGLKDKRHENKGIAPLLNEQEQEQL